MIIFLFYEDVSYMDSDQIGKNADPRAKKICGRTVGGLYIWFL